MKFKLKYLMLGLALAVAGCAAYFSVWGLSQLFAGASVAVIVMASILEIGKIVTTTALHTYWDKLAKPLRIYLSISVVILMVITSAGIYGFLSNAYQSTANKLEIHEGELGILDVKKQTFEKSVSDNQKIIESKTNRLDQLSNLRSNQESRLDNSNSNRAKNSVRNDIKSADNEIQKLNTEIDVLNTKNVVLSDSINVYNVKAIELKSGSSVAAEVGPLKYISQLTGAPMANIVNYMILLLIFVFDPLAVALILITNRVFQIESEDETKEPETKLSTEKIEEELKTDGFKKEQKQHIVDIMEFDEKFGLYEEPIEYPDDETIEPPVFENIIDPVDDKIIEEDVIEVKESNIIEEIEVAEAEVIEEIEVQIEPSSIEEEYDELHALDMVMNYILSDINENEIANVEEEVANVEEEVANVEEEVSGVEEEMTQLKNKIVLEDIKEIKERNRGFSVKIPEPRRNNMIQRINNK
jgi:hypothetical protein